MKPLMLALSLSLLPISGSFDRLFAQTAPASTATVNLTSPETGIDYSSLSQLLNAQQWRRANERTQKLMLRAVKREAQGWMSTQDVEKFSCWDLKTIDNLWKKASNGRFGFSIQFPIFLETGNRPGRLVEVDAYEKFGDRVGWRKQQAWIDFKENLTYNIDAPRGHLPNPRQEYQINGGRLEYVALTKRMVECKLVTLPKKAMPLSNSTNLLDTNTPSDKNEPLN